MSRSSLSSLPVVMFRHQGHLFAFEAHYVRQQGQSDGSADQSLVCFAELLMPGAERIPSTGSWLELWAPSVQPWRLGLAAPAELLELSIDGIQPLPLLLQLRSQFSALQALAWHQHELVALLNVAELHKIAVQPR